MAAEKIAGVIESLAMFRNLFDIVRVIDPIKKRVINCDSPGDDSFNFVCYDFWGTGKQCDNCISGRAIVENDTFMKIECQGDELYMVMASPITLNDQNYIVEMIKNITSNDIMTGVDQKYLEESNRVIAELNKKIVTDYLTCVYNRKYIDERLPVEIFEATSKDQRLSVLMIDIDLFKKVNDAYGHPAGDTALKTLCQLIQKNIRKESDWAARYGGEEFIVLLQDTDKDVAYRVAEKIRKVVEKEIIVHESHLFSITISIGAYTLEPGTKDSKQVIEEADRNLYKAKAQGRNETVST